MDTKRFNEVRHLAVNGKPINKMCTVFGDVEDPVECLLLLQSLTDLIHTLYSLSDSDYYLDYIWGSSTTLEEELRNEGFTSDYFDKLVQRFEKLRAILFGNSIDYDEMIARLKDETFVYEYYNRKLYEDRVRILEKELMKLKRERQTE